MSVRGYFDYNATTPMCPEAMQAFTSVLQGFGNPSSKHTLAKSSKQALTQARQQVARLLGCEAGQLVFTSGGTEGNNWAIKGALMARGAIGRAAQPAHIILAQIEHPSVLEIAAHLERVFGIEVTRLKPDADGIISAEAVEAALRPNTQLVSIMLVNNEVGTVQPVRQIARLLRSRGVHFHVDGVQAVGKIHVDVHALGIDTLSFAAHKFYGPKGAGGLFIRDGVTVEPLLHGGGQEGGQRGGTEAVASIAAMGAA
ncbi:MAG: cysteine desulfurase family protein, partial [Burkholderiaceae bacterium]